MSAFDYIQVDVLQPKKKKKKKGQLTRVEKFMGADLIIVYFYP